MYKIVNVMKLLGFFTACVLLFLIFNNFAILTLDYIFLSKRN